MHPFPPATSLQFLIGQDLESIQLSYWQIIFQFDKAAISIEGDLEHVDGAGQTRGHNGDENRRNPLSLHHLIGQKVQTLDAEPFLLALKFDQGDVLRVFSDEGRYECGQIYDDNELAAIF